MKCNLLLIIFIVLISFDIKAQDLIQLQSQIGRYDLSTIERDTSMTYLSFGANLLSNIKGSHYLKVGGQYAQRGSEPGLDFEIGYEQRSDFKFGISGFILIDNSKESTGFTHKGARLSVGYVFKRIDIDLKYSYAIKEKTAKYSHAGILHLAVAYQIF